MKVLKFGGSCLKNASDIQKVIEIIVDDNKLNTAINAIHQEFVGD